jgi:hypothetical protein
VGGGDAGTGLPYDPAIPGIMPEKVANEMEVQLIPQKSFLYVNGLSIKITGFIKFFHVCSPNELCNNMFIEGNFFPANTSETAFGTTYSLKDMSVILETYTANLFDRSGNGLVPANQASVTATGAEYISRLFQAPSVSTIMTEQTNIDPINLC